MNRRHFASLGIGSFFSSSLANAMAPPKIAIAQIGTKHAHAKGQLETLKACADFQVLGIAEPDPQQWNRVKNDPVYRDIPYFPVQDLLNIPQLQAVAVETDIDNLLPTAEQVIQAGYHLHLDKPPGEDLKRFERLLQQANQKQRLVKMGYMFRYNPAFMQLHELLHQNILGEIRSIHADISKMLSANERQTLLKYQGGAMFELGCHLLDQIVLMLGEPTKVTPFIQKGVDQYAEQMLAILEYPHAQVSLRSSMVEIHGGSRRQFTVSGTKGTFEIFPLEAPKARLMLETASGPYSRGIQNFQYSPQPRYAMDWINWAQSIRGEKKWAFTTAHDRSVQRTLFKACKLS